jgi:AcrR family transcriptional regulator
MAKGAETKRRIVDAAEEVVLRDGVAKLTLEAAAAEAGLSKGGVLYHFPTRDSLVTGMVERIIEEFEHDLSSDLVDPAEPGSFTRSYVRATLDPGNPQPDRDNRLGAALIAAVAAEPALLAPLRQSFDQWQHQVEADGLDPALATVLRLAADGLWLSELFGLAPLPASLRARVGNELERLARDPS